MDKKTIAIIAVVVILVVAIAAGIFLTQNKGAKPADTGANSQANISNAPANNTNTASQNTTSNAPSPNDYYIDEDGEREYYYDDYYDRD
ncbi:hypothetical protein [Methanobrevibacter sp.]|uniref:hypothetical protein n=1 Tax=Methanobrevibacter sp. TaxID=66852 RepID=UPI0038903FB8